MSLSLSTESVRVRVEGSIDWRRPKRRRLDSLSLSPSLFTHPLSRSRLLHSLSLSLSLTAFWRATREEREGESAPKEEGENKWDARVPSSTPDAPLPTSFDLLRPTLPPPPTPHFLSLCTCDFNSIITISFLAQHLEMWKRRNSSFLAFVF